MNRQAAVGHPPKNIRLAIIGCGAIAETGHLPGALMVPEVELSVLVDKDLARAQKLAAQFGALTVTDSLAGIEKLADAAILCLPHHLHCPVALDLMARGLHILVEKPMALSTDECDQMIAASQRAGVVLAVGLMRRYFRCAVFLKQVLTSQVLGAVKKFRIEDGGAYAWPSASPFVLSKAHSGGGVLMGNGSHVMDSLIWWFGEPQSISCFTNADGGMETDATVEMIMPGGALGTVELSRTRSLANRTQVWAERGYIEIPLYGDRVTLQLAGVAHSLAGQAKSIADHGDQDLTCVLADQLRDWVCAMRRSPSTLVTGPESRRSIALIENCYRHAQPLPESWSPSMKLV